MFQKHPANINSLLEEVSNIQRENNDVQNFYGYSLDFGAPRSVPGINQEMRNKDLPYSHLI